MRLSKAQREQVRMMFGGRCAYCGDPLGDRWHADHKAPVLRGCGANCQPLHPERHTLDNIVPACAPCNLDKIGFALEDWRRQLANKVNVLRKTSPFRHAARFGLVQETGAPVVFYFERIAQEQAA